MLPEYDLRQMRIVKRGPGYSRKPQQRETDEVELVTVTLDPDVAAVFNNEQAVNEALRTFIRVIDSQA